MDITGDGLADVLISEDDVFTWYQSLTKEGFATAERVSQALDEEEGPRLVFNDATQSIYLADMSGDGLNDLVRIFNWTSEDQVGGTYWKVIRWAFEQQGLYQPPGAPTPVTSVGSPPLVDAYVDDGRHGEYQYGPVSSPPDRAVAIFAAALLKKIPKFFKFINIDYIILREASCE